MTSEILNIYKPIGLSPLEAIKRFIEQNRAYKGLKMTYAGRLDPMAEGVLLVLTGAAVHKKDRYLKMDKEYEAEVLFGFETDTYDILGLPLKMKMGKISNKNIKQNIEKFHGEISLPLPPYSSYKVQGKPLFAWAREGRLNEIKIPTRRTKVHNIEFVKSYEIDLKDILNATEQKINKVTGDFRQDEIKTKWRELTKSESGKKFKIVKIKFTVSSGTYIRSIAYELGKKLGTGAILFSLLRTRVGEYEVKDSTKLS